MKPAADFIHSKWTQRKRFEVSRRAFWAWQCRPVQSSRNVKALDQLLVLGVRCWKARRACDGCGRAVLVPVATIRRRSATVVITNEKPPLQRLVRLSAELRRQTQPVHPSKAFVDRWSAGGNGLFSVPDRAPRRCALLQVGNPQRWIDRVL